MQVEVDKVSASIASKEDPGWPGCPATDYEVYDDEVLRLLVEDLQAVPLDWTYKQIIRNLVFEVRRLRAEAKS